MRSSPVVTSVALLLVVGACKSGEQPGAAQARARKALYEQQIVGLEAAIERGRQQGGLNRDSILIGVDEAVFREIVGVALPIETPLGDHVRLRLVRAEPFFRYTRGVLLFDGRLISVDRPSLFLGVRLAGGLDRAALEGGRLTVRVKLYYFELQGAALGELGKSVIEGLVRENLDQIADAVPPIEVPVRLEQGIMINGFAHGPVSVQPGRLPFEVSVQRVLAVQGRLWLRIDVKAGPWQRGPAASPAPQARPAGTSAAPPARRGGA